MTFAWDRQHRKHATRNIKRSKRSQNRGRTAAFRQVRRLMHEPLESRQLLSATLFVDFGDNFPSGTLSTTQGAFRDVADDPNPGDKILGTELVDDNDGFNAGTALDIVRQTFTASERAQMMAVVRRAYLPLDVNVVELTANVQTTIDGRDVRGAASMADVVDTLRAGDPASKDTYVFVATFVVDPGGANERTYTGGGGLSPDSPTLGVPSDLVAAANNHDDVVAVYSSGGFSHNTLNNIAHEAGHGFGLQHAITNAATSAAVNLFHQADIMSYQNTNATTSSIAFTRYPMIRGDDNSPSVGANPQDYDDLAARNGQVTLYDQLRFDPNVGVNPDYSFVSGTGAHDIITITRDGNNADVSIQAFADASYTTPITVPGVGGDTYSYSFPLSGAILVYGGGSNDRFVIGADLGVDVHIDGMLGNDSLVVQGYDAANIVYTPDPISPIGVDLIASLGGTIELGTSRITFEGFETAGSVTVQNVRTLSYVTPPAGGDDLIVRRRATDGLPEIVGTVNDTVAVVPLALAGVGRLSIATGPANDSLTVDSSEGLVILPFGIDFDGGGGFDRLNLVQTGGAVRANSRVNVGALPGSGQSVIDGQVVNFQNLEPLADIVPATVFTVSSAPGIASLLQTANSITYGPGQLLGPAAGRVVVDSFEPIEFSNKIDLQIDGGAGDDVIVVNNGLLPTGLQTIHVNGDDGNDVIRILSLPDAMTTSFVSLTASGGAGDDVIDAGRVKVDTPVILYGDDGDDVLVGGRGDDQLDGGAGDDVLVGGDPSKGSPLLGNNTYRGGDGFDTIVLLGTKANDTLDVSQPSAVALSSILNGSTSNESLPNADIEQVRIDLGAGNDVVRVTIADALFAPAAHPADDVLRFHVLGGSPNASDSLNVVDDGLGDTVIQRIGDDPRSGTISIAPAHPNGAAPPIVYEGMEHVFVTPIDAITGGTGADGEGRLVVFKPDPWESNDTRPTAAFVGSGPSVNVDPTIDPGAGPLGLPADQDFFRVVAAQTGTLDYQVYFDAVPALANARSGLPGDGLLRLELRDSDGTLIGVGTDLVDPVGDVIGQRFAHAAVRNQTYYLRVLGATGDAINVYSFTVLNVPAPTPSLVDLQAASDSGRSDNDDVTNVVQATFDIILDDDRLDEFTNLNLVPDITDDNAPDAAADYGVQVFNNGVPIGYAFYTGGGNTWRFTAAAGDLLEGHGNRISAAVWVRDGATPAQVGRGDWGPALQVTLDTTPPPISILGLAPLSDSGVAGYPGTLADRVTNDTAVRLVGRAEADAIVRFYADATANNAIDNPALFSLTVAAPHDGDEAFPNGQWSAAFVRDLNDPAVFPFDGVRELLVTAEDLAGNVNTLGDLVGDVDQVLRVFVDTQGPQITRVDVNSPGNPYDLFDPKPSTSGPTPLVRSLVISVRDLPARSGADPVFLYAALLAPVAENVGHYSVVGDANGAIPIKSVQFISDPVVDGQPATGRIELTFFKPLPDDRYTLVVRDSLVDHAGNALDGESNAAEPQEDPNFPSGDAQPGGAFVGRFTVDSRPELAVYHSGSVWVDTNGNSTFDPTNADFTNRDLVYMLGFTTDNLFAGNFSPPGAGSVADGFDKLAAYGRVGSSFRWLIDMDNDGVPDPPTGIIEPRGQTAIPVAGNFDGDGTNGDEVGFFTGSEWWLDTNHDFQVDTRIVSPLRGLPVVGDFDGDGLDDLATWKDDKFYFDLAHNGFDQLDATIDFGFIGVREKPIAADMDGDGIDDIGLFVPDRAGVSPAANAEWYFLISNAFDQPLAPRFGTVHFLDHEFSPVPLGNDRYASYGDEFSAPIVGNFDPPVAQSAPGPVRLGSTNLDNPFDVNGDGQVSPLDVLVLINDLNRSDQRAAGLGHLDGPFLDVNSDGLISAADVLATINYLEARTIGNAGGEGESMGVEHPLASAVSRDLPAATFLSETPQPTAAGPSAASEADRHFADPDAPDTFSPLTAGWDPTNGAAAVRRAPVATRPDELVLENLLADLATDRAAADESSSDAFFAGLGRLA